MQTERWQLLRRILEQAFALDAEQRLERVRELCGEDEALFREARRLLEADSREDGTLEPPSRSDWVRDAEQRDPLIGRRIGRHRVIRRVARGGMGILYEAEQDQPRRRVALKVVDSLQLGDETRVRFEREAEFLGRLQHPALCHIHESGTFTLDGIERPFIAMEWIEGEQLLQHAERQALSVRQRIGLVLQMCEALEHAHRHSILHRDLKPANVMVTADGQVKVLDFGVARLMSGEDTAGQSVHTRTGQLVGTVTYMSPEQVSQASALLDERSDLYSLGIVTYELLVGCLPYDVGDAPLHEAARRIETQPPRRPSQVNSEVSGDLEAVLLKVLEKDPARRYDGASSLAQDLVRVLRHEPVLARPPSKLHQLRMQARRNPVAAALVVAIALLLVASTLVSSVLGWQQWKARQAAEQQTRIAEEVDRFLRHDLLASVDPRNTTDPDITMREVLDRAARALEGRFEDDPLVEAALRRTLSMTYRGLGRPDLAETQARRCLELRRAALGDDDLLTWQAREELGVVMALQGRYEEAVQVQTDVLAARQRLMDDGDPWIENSLTHLALSHGALGRIDESERLFRRCLDRRVRRGPPGNAPELEARSNLGSTLVQLGRIDEGVAQLERALEGRRQLLGDEHPETLSTVAALLEGLVAAGRYTEALRIGQTSLPICRRILGTGHSTALRFKMTLAGVHSRLAEQDVAEELLREAVAASSSQTFSPTFHARAQNDLGLLLRDAGRLDEAEQLLRQALQQFQAALGDDHPQTWAARANLGGLQVLRGQLGPAAALFTELHQRCEERLGPDHSQTVSALADLAWVRWQQRDLAQAESLSREVLERRRRALGDEHPNTATACFQLGDVLLLGDRPEEAAPLLHEAYEVRGRVLGEEHPDTLVAHSMVSVLLARQGEFESAESEAAATLDLARMTLPDGHWYLGTFLQRHGECLARLGEYETAEAELLEARDRLDHALGPAHWRTREAEQTLAAFYTLTGDTRRAEEWRDRAQR